MVGKLCAQINSSEILHGIKPFRPNSVSALGNLKMVKDMNLAKEFQGFARDLPWTPSHRSVDNGSKIAIMDLNDVFEMNRVRAGFIYVDIDQTYPEHNHPPDEIYFLISGTAKWRWGGNHNYQTITAGNLIYNHPYNWHGVCAGHTPVLALYLQTA